MTKLKMFTCLLFSAVLISSSCNRNKEIAQTEVTEMEETDHSKENSDSIQSVQIITDYQFKTTDSFTLLESNIEGDILSLLVQYSGGCETHEWGLKTNGAYAKSLPPQITLYIEHNSNKDMCRALLRDTIEFNLNTIRYQGTSEVIVRLNGAEDKEPIRYKY